MADETKSADPAPREAARDALDRMRTAAADNESDADSAITLVGYDSDDQPPVSDDVVEWHVAHFDPSHSSAFAAAGWRRSRVDRLYENESCVIRIPEARGVE